VREGHVIGVLRILELGLVQGSDLKS